MSDIAIIQIGNENPTFDLNFLDDDFETDEGLRTAVTISLFTDRRVSPEELPPEEKSLRGWWGDAFEAPGDFTGSKLWLLQREKITPEVLRKHKQYAEESLAWLIADNVAAAVEVFVERMGTYEVGLETRIRRPDGRDVSFRYAVIWANT